MLLAGLGRRNAPTSPHPLPIRLTARIGALGTALPNTSTTVRTKNPRPAGRPQVAPPPMPLAAAKVPHFIVCLPAVLSIVRSDELLPERGSGVYRSFGCVVEDTPVATTVPW